jgi:hypothetical protein
MFHRVLPPQTTFFPKENNLEGMVYAGGKKDCATV